MFAKHLVRIFLLPISLPQALPLCLNQSERGLQAWGLREPQGDREREAMRGSLGLLLPGQEPRQEGTLNQTTRVLIC